MKQDCLGENQYILEARIRKRIILCVVLILLTVAVNIAIACLRTKENHTLFMLLNMGLDIVVGWFCLWQFDSFIRPYGKLLKLYRKNGSVISGVVEKISTQTRRYYGFDCMTVTVDGHKLFVIDNGCISLEPARQVTVEIVHGIVKEVAL